MSWVAVAIGGSALIGAFASNKASKRAAKGTQKGIDATNALLSPYTEAGAQNIGSLQKFIEEGATFSDTQAYKDIVNSAKAGGMNLSGNRLTALTDYYANNFRPQQFAERSYLTTVGANAAARQATNLGSLYNTQGQTNAAGTLGIGNSLSSGLNSLAFLGMVNQGSPSGSNTAGFGVGNYGTYGGNPNAGYIPPTSSYWSK